MTRPDPDRSDQKREEYLALVTFGLQAMLSARYGQPDLSTLEKAIALGSYMSDLSSAYGAASKLPADKSALGAALDVVDYFFSRRQPGDGGPGDSWLEEVVEGRERRYRASWAGFAPLRARPLQTRPLLKSKQIDGRRRKEKPDWHGLPFNDSVALEALSWVRSEEKIFLSELARQMPKVAPAKIEARLNELEKTGWVKADREPDGSMTYERTIKLGETGDSNTWHRRLPVPTFATRAVRYHARRRAERDDHVATFHQVPYVAKLLRAIKSDGPLQLKDLQPLQPRMNRLALRNLMIRLRDLGWVECVGRGGGAAWKASEKLMREGATAAD